LLYFCPRNRPTVSGNEVLSFAHLGTVLEWPQNSVTRLLAKALEEDRPCYLPTEIRQMLAEKGIIRSQNEDRLFPLREVSPGFFTNSTRGRDIGHRILKTQGHMEPFVVLDSLSLEDIAELPLSGNFLYLGDKAGGLYASDTGTTSVPCSRCLLRRYLAGRRATTQLYGALQNGNRIAFGQAQLGPEFQLECPGVHLFGVDQDTDLGHVLPLPDCRHCTQVLPPSPACLRPGFLAPVTHHTSQGKFHYARLPQMIWLTGHETVGFGSSWSEDHGLGRQKSINEALERYSAHFTPPGSDHRGVLFFADNEQIRLSHRQALLTETGSVSTGLACRRNLNDAIEDGLREVCERDALARFWLRADHDEPSVFRLQSIRSSDLEIVCYQLPSFVAPTVMALGRAPHGGVFVGTACGTLTLAIDKAVSECLQVHESLARSQGVAVEIPTTFEEHGLYYWQHPERFPDLVATDAQVWPLEASTYHCDLTPSDLKALGYYAVRVHVPRMMHIPQDHRDWKEMLSEAQQDSAVPTRPHPFY
jgi:YcaO cyclodehydratase, ATP-ad Mg2+-binding